MDFLGETAHYVQISAFSTPLLGFLQSFWPDRASSCRWLSIRLMTRTTEGALPLREKCPPQIPKSFFLPLFMHFPSLSIVLDHHLFRLSLPCLSLSSRHHIALFACLCDPPSIFVLSLGKTERDFLRQSNNGVSSMKHKYLYSRHDDCDLYLRASRLLPACKRRWQAGRALVRRALPRSRHQ